jgi:type I restriction enzyme, S subunit
MSFPRYPKYKPSGVEWLGDVPAHWEVTRLKRACTASPSNIDKKSYDGEQTIRLCNYTDVYYNDFITADLDFMVATASQAQIEKFTLRAGDTIITKDSETADDIAVAAFVPKDLPGVVCGYHLSLIRPLNTSSGAFVKWWFASRFAKSSFAVRANGLTRVGLGQHELENVGLAFPPLPEQRAIAAFLDRETAKIDGLVAEQQRLIELLKEKRQAVISHAVTKGLDPKAPMKPSGVEWLGDVPEHWEVKRLKQVVAVPITDGPHETPVFLDEGVPFISAEAVSGGYIDFTRARSCISHEDNVRFSQKYAPSLGDIYMVKAGATTGVTAIVTERVDFNIWSPLAAIRCGNSLLPNYLLNFLRSRAFQDAVALGWSFGTQQNIGMGVLGNLFCLVPPLEEQSRIAAFLDRETAKIDTLVTEAESAITLLQERRSALISAAVTGQIDVRNVVATEAA